MPDQVLPTEPERKPLPENLEEWEDRRAEFEEFHGVPVAAHFAIETPKDAARLMARLRYFNQQKAFFTEPFDEEITRLQAEIAHLQQERDKVAAQWENRAAWYRSSLEFWARQASAADPKVKTIALPYGTLKVRPQQPEWTYDDEVLLDYLRPNRPEFVRIKVEPNKVDLKKVVKVDGAHVLDPQTGEIIPGITITERPPKFELEVAG